MTKKLTSRLSKIANSKILIFSIYINIVACIIAALSLLYYWYRVIFVMANVATLGYCRPCYV